MEFFLRKSISECKIGNPGAPNFHIYTFHAFCVIFTSYNSRPILFPGIAHVWKTFATIRHILQSSSRPRRPFPSRRCSLPFTRKAR